MNVSILNGRVPAGKMKEEGKEDSRYDDEGQSGFFLTWSAMCGFVQQCHAMPSMISKFLSFRLSRSSELSALETTVTCLQHDIQLLDDDGGHCTGWSLGVSDSALLHAHRRLLQCPPLGEDTYFYCNTLVLGVIIPRHFLEYSVLIGGISQ
jgi:hypothetical protein